TGTACYVKNSQKILTQVEQLTQIHAGETTIDGQISLMTARCLGACGVAPAFFVDGVVLGNQTPESV
ncbi:MAG: NAD(P)H-dependent oxidoreductase subunit E, partial [Dolichospermum sp.]